MEAERRAERARVGHPAHAAPAALMQPNEKQQQDASTGGSLSYEEEQQIIPGSGRRKLRVAAAKAIDRGKRVAEMILECNEDGEHGEDDERDAEDAGSIDAPGGGGRGGEDAEEFVGEDDGESNGSLYRRKPIKTRWSAAEDTKLKQLVDVHGSGNWRVVSGSGRLEKVVRVSS